MYCCLLIAAVALQVACTAAVPPRSGAAPTSSLKLSDAPASPAPVAAIASPSPSPSPSPLPLKQATIRLATAVPSAGHWQFFVAERKGFYQKYALKVETSTGQTDSKMIEGLASASYDVVAASSDSVIGAVEKGSGITIVAGSLNRAAYSLMVGREIGSYADVKGKPVGMADPKGGSTALLKKMLAANGVSDGSYNLVQLAGAGALAGGVMNGTVAAALVDQPADFQLIDQRFQSLGSSTTVAPEYQTVSVTVATSWARSNEETLARFLRALVDADAWLYDSANKPDAVALLSEYARSTNSASVKTYDLLIGKSQALPRAGEASLPGLRTAVELMADLDLLKRPLPGPEKYVDGSYLEKAKRLQR